MSRIRRLSIINLIITVLCFTVICLGLGFCLISTRLSEYKKSGTKYDVRIISIDEGTPIKGGTTVPNATYKITNCGHTVDFVFNVYNPKDSMTYTATIKNMGDIEIKIDKVVESLNYNKKILNPITINYNDIDGQILKSGEEVKLTISIEYGVDGISNYKKIPYSINILTSSNKQNY